MKERGPIAAASVDRSLILTTDHWNLITTISVVILN